MFKALKSLGQTVHNGIKIAEGVTANVLAESTVDVVGARKKMAMMKAARRMEFDVSDLFNNVKEVK